MAFPRINPTKTPIVSDHGLKNAKRKIAKAGPPRIPLIDIDAWSIPLKFEAR